MRYLRSRVTLLAAVVAASTFACSQTPERLSQSRSQSQVSAGLSRLPLPARSKASAAIGRDFSSYHAQKTERGFHEENPRQQLTVDFAQQGVKVTHRTVQLTMSLSSYGYGDVSQRVTPISPQASFNRVEYHHGPLTEWYVNGPAGLEQGFTFDKRPNGANGQPLTIALLLSGDLKASLDREGTALTLFRNDLTKPELRYAGLSAHDATGQELHAWLELKDSELHLRVDDAGARYPVVVDPVVQLAELTASDGVDGDFLGISVAITGNTVVVGSVNATIGGNAGQGAAYVFVKPANGWTNMTQTAKLTASDGQAGDGFGGSVGIAGNTIVVGACSQSGICNGPGKVYVFLRPAGGWMTTSKFAAELTASDGQATDGFSNEMSISADGNTVVVGSANATVGGQASEGAAYIFVKPSGGWKTMTETAKLTEPYGAAYDLFCCVSVSGNGSTIFVGALQYDFTDNLPTGPGKAYIFIRPAGGWKSTSIARAILTAADGDSGDFFGFCQAGSSCLSSDGTTVLAAAPYANGFQGKAYIFVRPAGGWITTSQYNAELTLSDGQTDYLGWSAAVTSNFALVGAVAGNGGTGGAYVFIKPKTGWATTSNFNFSLIPSDGQIGDAFAFSLAVSGETGVVGSINHPAGSSSGPGAAYVFGP
jgi:trimeric autotransporter adhesin